MPAEDSRTDEAVPMPEGLRWCSDEAPGISRRRAGRGFCYQGPDGKRITSERVLSRIRSLVIPPAWQDVWICPHANGHIQATGRDARNRKQYRYHPDWTVAQSSNKFDRLSLFAARLPRLEKAIEQALARRRYDEEKVVATAVRLLQLSLIRVGNARYSRQNRSYGLTTLRKRHIEISGQELRFHFRGKSGVEHEVSVQDRRLATIIRRLNELPGQTLFQYRCDDGTLGTVRSEDINAFIRAHMGEAFSAKDFRTWAATLHAAQILCAMDTPTSPAEARRKLNACMKRVAGRLGNTPSVCRSSYVHPRIIDLFTAQTLATSLPQPQSRLFPKAVAALIDSGKVMALS